MNRFIRAGLITIVVGLVAALGGCAATGGGSPAEVPVPVANIDTVAGTWKGLLERGSSRREDYIELTINRDSTFKYSTARTVGVLQGSGTLTLKDGQLSSTSEHGSATYRLYDRAGSRVLKVEAVETRGIRYSAELTR